MGMAGLFCWRRTARRVPLQPRHLRRKGDGAGLPPMKGRCRRSHGLKMLGLRREAIRRWQKRCTSRISARAATAPHRRCGPLVPPDQVTVRNGSASAWFLQQKSGSKGPCPIGRKAWERALLAGAARLAIRPEKVHGSRWVDKWARLPKTASGRGTRLGRCIFRNFLWE